MGGLQGTGGEGVRPLVLADGLVLGGEAEVRDAMMKGVQLIEADVGFFVDWLRETPAGGRIMAGGRLVPAGSVRR